MPTKKAHPPAAPNFSGHRQNWTGWEGEIEMRPILNEDRRPDRNK
jgi:hypothetical protein